MGGAAAGLNAPRAVIKAYPLLFDENRQRKNAYWAVVNFQSGIIEQGDQQACCTCEPDSLYAAENHKAVGQAAWV